MSRRVLVLLAGLARARGLSMSASTGYDVGRFAGRYALGKNLPTLTSKQGLKFNWKEKGEVRVVGGASSEVLGGANLAAVLEDGWEVERRAYEALRQNAPAEALSSHTSAGTPPGLDRFITALEPHLPVWAQREGDWCVNLQAEGSSAVHAAIDMCLQATQPGADLTAPAARTKVACGASSYHGPASTSPGGGIPLGTAAKGLTHPVRYPVPSPFLRHRGEADAAFHERLLVQFIEYLDAYEQELGVVLFEPQWGSSVASTPWPPGLLRAYIREAKSRGLAVICDEIMCGLGRHGREPRGATGCFLTECWELEPDCVTFGKSIGGGAGHLLSGAVLLRGAATLATASRTAYQSHTYAGASARALLNGANILDRLTALRTDVLAVEAAVKPILDQLEVDSRGRVLTQGQGALWGGLFAHADLAERTAANLALKKKCSEAGVLPYFVPVGGFMLTPRYDDDPAELAGAVADIARCCLEVADEMGWGDESLLPLPRGAPAPVALAAEDRFRLMDLTDEQASIREEARALGGNAALEGPLLAAPGVARKVLELAKALEGLEVLDDRDAAVAELAASYHARCGAAWTAAAARARARGALEDEAVAALARGATPPFAPGSRDAAVYGCVVDLLRHKRVGAPAYAAARDALGDAGLAELISLVGYHQYLALTLNAFEIGGVKDPWAADAALLSDGELADLVAAAGAGNTKDLCDQMGCDVKEARLEEEKKVGSR